jgi:AraC family transcriptional regulator
VKLAPRHSDFTTDAGSEFTIPGFAVHRVTLPSADAGYDYSWQGKTHYLALHDIQLRDGETFCDAHGPSRKADLRSTLTFVPAGERIWGWSLPSKRHNSFVAVYYDPKEMDGDIRERFASAPLRSQVYFLNAALHATMTKLGQAMQPQAVRDRLYLESLCVTAALELCHVQHQLLDPTPARVGRLSALQMQAVNDYIQENLASDIGLTELAACAGLSRFHFIRAFRRTSGNTPYQHLLYRRIECARLLLEQPHLTVEKVARAVGFQNTSRFIRTFQRITGVRPGAQSALARGYKSSRGGGQPAEE